MTEPTLFQTAQQLQRARQGVTSMGKGTHAKVRCVVRSVEVKKGQRGDYLNLTLGDRTGDVNAKSWDGAALAKTINIGTVVELARLEVDDYGPKFEPRDLTILAPGQYEAADFVPSLPLEVIEENWRLLHETLETLENPHLLRLRDAVFSQPEVAAKYKTHPSAVRHHHNYLGGNVEHVLGITRVIDAVCKARPELDRDLLILGAVVHDLGKLREYAVDTTITVTEAGRLRGHLVIGAEWLGQVCEFLRHDGYDLPQGVQEHLVHMILSHHRKGEWGSPKPPATPEAFVLHLADYIDSQTQGFLHEMERNKDAPEGWAQRWDSDAGEKVWMRTRRDWD